MLWWVDRLSRSIIGTNYMDREDPRYKEYITGEARKLLQKRTAENSATLSRLRGGNRLRRLIPDKTQTEAIERYLLAPCPQSVAQLFKQHPTLRQMVEGSAYLSGTKIRDAQLQKVARKISGLDSDDENSLDVLSGVDPQNDILTADATSRVRAISLIPSRIDNPTELLHQEIVLLVEEECRLAQISPPKQNKMLVHPADRAEHDRVNYLLREVAFATPGLKPKPEKSSKELTLLRQPLRDLEAYSEYPWEIIDQIIASPHRPQ